LLEKSVEDYLKREVERRGGLCLKLKPEGARGIPDRLVLLPNGVVLFVEVKRPRGGVVAELQHWWARRIRGLGTPAHVTYTRRNVDDLLAAYSGGAPAEGVGGAVPGLDAPE
jgi:hypothetical protein